MRPSTLPAARRPHAGAGPGARGAGPLAMTQVAPAATSSNPASILENLQLSDAKANVTSLSLSVSGCGHRQVYATADDTHPTRTHVLVSVWKFVRSVASGWAWLGLGGEPRNRTPPAPAVSPRGRALIRRVQMPRGRHRTCQNRTL